MPEYTKLNNKTYDNKGAQNTEARAQTIRIRKEMKWPYERKQQINKQLHQTHQYNTNIWKQTWDNIEGNMKSKLHTYQKISTTKIKT